MPTATHIYRNGTIVTMDSRASTVEALAVKDDVILAVGTEREVLAYKDKDTEIIDLRGSTLFPGFIDGHSHFINTGLLKSFQLDMSSPPIGGVRNLQDIKDKLRAKIAQTPPGEWVQGFGYDDTALAEMRHPLAADLDEVSPDNPVFLKHVAGSLAMCNSRALELAGYTKDTPQPDGGLIRRDAQGNPTGVLEGHPAIRPVLGLIPAYGEKEWMQAIANAAAIYTAKGVTSAQDGATSSLMWQRLQEAYAKKHLNVRVQILPSRDAMDLTAFKTTASGTQLTADKMISLGAVKMVTDASIQGYTGFLSIPYHKVIYDLPGGSAWRGYPAESEHSFTAKVEELHCRGWQLAIHGNGDAAIEMIINAFESAQKKYPRANARHIIIHCQTVREDQLDRMQRLGILASFFVVHTYYWGERHREIFLGEDRARRINPLRSALQRNIIFNTHNDTYITPIDPLLSVWSAVNRTTSKGNVLGEEQTIPVVDALRSITTWAAHLACEENIKGSLEPGKLADMVVLEENPLTCPKEHIKDIKIQATIVGNKLVYGAL